MSDYAHNTMKLEDLYYQRELVRADWYAELDCNAQDNAAERLAELELIQEQINEINNN